MAVSGADYSKAGFHDPRLAARLRVLTEALEARPGRGLPEACGTPAALKGAYRFLDHPEVTPGRILPAFSRPAARRLRARGVVLAVHDSTSLNYSGLKSAEGPGYINDSPTAKGIHLHSSLLLTGAGALAGLGHLKFWVRKDFRKETPQGVRDLPLEEKESVKWVEGLRAVHALLAAEAGPGGPPRVVHVCDREGDVHEVFAEVKALGADAVIRCAQDRRVEAEAGGEGDPPAAGYAKARVARQAPSGVAEVEVPAAAGGRRVARLELRAVGVVLRPNTRKHKGRNPLRLWLVEAREVAPPAGEEAALWRIWTTLPARRIDQALRVMAIYKARWRVEDYHRALKTGCGAERLRLQSGEALMKAVTVMAHVAARVTGLRDQAKASPEQGCEPHFTREEWKLLFAKRHGRPWREADGKPTLGEAVLWLGRLAGHQNRKSDPMPGAECLSRALFALELLLEGAALARAEAPTERPKHE